MSVSEIKKEQDNSKDKQTVTGKRLLSYVERIERLNEEKDALTEDIKEVFVEVKAAGFDVKVTRDIVKYRKMDAEKRREYFDLLGVYAEAVQLNLF